MNRNELLKSPAYWTQNLQLSLYNAVNSYLEDNNITRSAFASQLGVTRGYVTQILNGDFDHKLSKLVELSLACGLVPSLTFKPIEEFVNGLLAPISIPTFKKINFSSPISYTGDSNTAFQLSGVPDTMPEMHSTSTVAWYMVRFRMRNIDIEQFAVLSEKLPADATYSLSTTLGFMYSLESKVIGCSVDLTISISENQPILKLSLRCDFEIHSDDWQSLIGDDKFTLTKSLQEFLAVQTIGASRGVLFCKTEGLLEHAIILPPINATQLISGDAVFPLGDSASNSIKE